MRLLSQLLIALALLLTAVPAHAIALEQGEGWMPDFMVTSEQSNPDWCPYDPGDEMTENTGWYVDFFGLVPPGSISSCSPRTLRITEKTYLLVTDVALKGDIYTLQITRNDPDVPPEMLEVTTELGIPRNLPGNRPPENYIEEGWISPEYSSAKILLFPGLYTITTTIDVYAPEVSPEQYNAELWMRADVSAPGTLVLTLLGLLAAGISRGRSMSIGSGRGGRMRAGRLTRRFRRTSTSVRGRRAARRV